MHFGELNVPDALVDALREDRLVLFAGAGVSVGAPSSLPGFEGLIKKLEKRTFRDRRSGESFEQYLGRLFDEGVPVHKMVRDELDRPLSFPTPIHCESLRLFGTADRVRIVTTNFDRHFSKAASEVYDGLVPEHTAPAVPLGHDFHGIVYLHGSLAGASQSLVLSDSDFSRAYLTEGWARRFLRQLFANYVVLFLGYSHGDDVMRYLARGIPADADSGRYAFDRAWEEQDDEQDRRVFWDYYGVTAALFPKADGTDPYAELPRALRAWTQYATDRPSARERRIQGLVTIDEAPDQQDEDILLDALRRPSTTRYFTRHAKSFKWVEWADSHDLLTPLFSGEALSATDEELASWLAGFSHSHPNKALTFIGSRHLLNPELAEQIARVLYNHRDDKVASRELANTWILYVLQETNRNPIVASIWLDECVYPEDQHLAALLFRYFSHLKLDIWRNPFAAMRGGETYPYVDIRFEHEDDRSVVEDAWTSYFLPNLDGLHPEAETILTERLSYASDLYVAVGSRHAPHRDPISKPWEQSDVPPADRTEDVDVLVAAAWDLMHWLCENRPERARCLINRWASSHTPILELWALRGLMQLDLGADEMMTWLLDRGWLFERGLRWYAAELVIDRCCACSGRVQDRLVEFTTRHVESIKEDPTNAHELQFVFDLLDQIADRYGACDKLRQVEDILDMEIQPQAPNGSEEEQPKTIFILAQSDPRRDLDDILQFADNSDGGDRGDDVASTFKRTIENNATWSLHLADALAESNAWDTKIWEWLTEAWRRVSFTEAQWRELFDMIRNRQHLRSSYVSELSSLLRYAIDSHRESLPETLYPEAIQVSDLLFKEAEQEPKQEDRNGVVSYGDHPYALLLTVYYYILVRQEGTGTINETYRRRVERIPELPEAARAGATFAVAYSSRELYAQDRDWTTRAVAPLFCWTDETTALAAWSAAFEEGRFPFEMVSALGEPLIRAVRHHNGLSKERQSYLPKALATITAGQLIAPLGDRWLFSIIEALPEEPRLIWARYMRERLRELNDETTESIWRSWLRDYWMARLEATPVALSAEEAKEMLRWLPFLDPVFRDAVEVATQMKEVAMEHQFDVLQRLKGSDHIQNSPQATIELMDYLLHQDQAERFPFLHAGKEILTQLCQNKKLHSRLDPLLERAIELGFISADEKEELLGIA